MGLVMGALAGKRERRDVQGFTVGDDDDNTVDDSKGGDGIMLS